MRQSEKISTPRKIHRAEIVDDGIVITFDDTLKAFFDPDYLYDHSDVSGNFPLGEDEDDI